MDPKAVCLGVYAETQDFHARIASELGDVDHGFRVLYGPPVVGAPNLFLGFQPGGRLSDMKDDQHAGWPERCDYAHATWLLAKRMRAVWGAPLLDRCTGLNMSSSAREARANGMR